MDTFLFITLFYINTVYAQVTTPPIPRTSVTLTTVAVNNETVRRPTQAGITRPLVPPTTSAASSSTMSFSTVSSTQTLTSSETSTVPPDSDSTSTVAIAVLIPLCIIVIVAIILVGLKYRKQLRGLVNKSNVGITDVDNTGQSSEPSHTHQELSAIPSDHLYENTKTLTNHSHVNDQELYTDLERNNSGPNDQELYTDLRGNNSGPQDNHTTINESEYESLDHKQKCGTNKENDQENMYINLGTTMLTGSRNNMASPENNDQSEEPVSLEYMNLKYTRK